MQNGLRLRITALDREIMVNNTCDLAVDGSYKTVNAPGQQQVFASMVYD